MHGFSLKRTSSRVLAVDDVFILIGSTTVYRVYYLSDKFVHGMEDVTERTVRLPRDLASAPIEVNLAIPNFSGRFSGLGAETSFLMTA